MNARTKRLFWRALPFALAVLVFIYIFYQYYHATHVAAKTEVVRQTTVSDTESADLFVIRNESYLKTDKDGILIPMVTSGSRIAAGEAVVAIFPNQEAASRFAELDQVEEDLKRYTRLNQQKDISAVNLNALGRQISNEFIDLAGTVDSGDLSTMQTQIDDLRDRLLARQIATGEPVVLENKVTELESRRSALTRQVQGYETLQAEHAGYYIDSVDGYETATNYDKVKKLTPDDIAALLKSEPEEVSDKVIGKLSSDFDWYLVCTLDAGKTKNLKKGDSVTIDLPNSAVSSLSTTVYSKSKPDKKDRVAVVFRCNRMNEYIASLRKEPGEIVLHTYTGLKIPKDALVTNEDGESGVYVLEGNIAKFKKLRMVYSEDDYVVSSETAEEGEKGDYVKLYDAVILEGKDLYDGKIME